MVAVARQTEIGGLDTEAEEKQSAEAGYVWRERLWSAMRSFVESYIDADNGLKKHDGCAFRLNQRWEKKGRPVTGGALKNALEDVNRNNFRLEWAYWFAEQDEEIAVLLGCKVKPKKTTEELLDATDAEIRALLSPKEAEKLFRRRDAR